MSKDACRSPIRGETPASLYIHVPFCMKKCRYCDFVSYIYNEHNARNYVKGLRRELELRLAEYENKRWPLTTVFIGGGTPTCLSTELILEIILIIREGFNLSGDTEFTIEANPGTLDGAKLYTLRRAGVNRISIGAQACQEDLLHVLGRIHTHTQTVEAVRLARESGFDNVNLDLIFGIPGQTAIRWRDCLEQVISLQPDHISAYGLQLEENTPLRALVEDGSLTPCSEDDELCMYDKAKDLLADAGLFRYEISNYARPGRECRHNLRYWHNGQYLGLGPAAHSRLGQVRMANEEKLAVYLSKLADGILPTARQEWISPENDIFETVFLGLRMTKGLNLAEFSKRFNCKLEDKYPGVLERLLQNGLLQVIEGNICLTGWGMKLSNTVMAEFVPITNC